MQKTRSELMEQINLQEEELNKLKQELHKTETNINSIVSEMQRTETKQGKAKYVGLFYILKGLIHIQVKPSIIN